MLMGIVYQGDEEIYRDSVASGTMRMYGVLICCLNPYLFRARKEESRTGHIPPGLSDICPVHLR